MINKLKIENYKSIKDLTIDLGRVNVFIGTNGSGKSNILEGMAIGAAAANRKLDNEFLALRGIRISDPRLMRNAFDIADTDKPIKISFERGEDVEVYSLLNNNEDYSKWEVESSIEADLYEVKEKIDVLKGKKDLLKESIEFLNPIDFRIDVIRKMIERLEALQEVEPNSMAKALENFIIYSPENNELRKFEDESKIEPLGIYGEGLFKLIKSMNKAEVAELKSNLDMIDWFEDFHVKEDLSMNEKRIQLKDRYIDDKISFFDQRSANEGFLFLLFYISILVSRYTPKIFGIDNIDNALNPKLCKDLLKSFVKLCEKHDRQVLLTTHNPAILDGMNLAEANQRLFVVFRNLEGVTKLERIDEKVCNANSNVRLSEAFSRGYIGGLNENMMCSQLDDLAE